MELDPSMYAVFATYVVKDGAGDDVAALLREHIAATRQEPGCVAAFANRDADNASVFRMYEVYADDSSFKQHLDSPHYARYVAGGIRPLLADRTVVTANPII